MKFKYFYNYMKINYNNIIFAKSILNFNKDLLKYYFNNSLKVN